ncbi:MAG: hypothetical protein HYT46_02955 [Candidatus Vogelbacteria bacterium]|nr:hypothetical protein [Candidatus Vogelbacteria bacterium]
MIFDELSRLAVQSPIPPQFEVIYRPNDPMRSIHRQFLNYLGGLTASSGRDRVKSLPRRLRQLCRRYPFFYAVEIVKPYESVDGLRLADILVELDPELAGLAVKVNQGLVRFGLLRGEGRGLIDGIDGETAVPRLWDLYAEVHIDERLEPLVRRSGLTYVRYRDLLVFFAVQPIDEETQDEISAILTGGGFELRLNRPSRLAPFLYPARGALGGHRRRTQPV